MMMPPRNTERVIISRHHPVLPTTYRPFFAWIFEHVAYRNWKTSRDPARMLRVIGGPGSGKVLYTHDVEEEKSN
jgi:hypothetical protein